MSARKAKPAPVPAPSIEVVPMGLARSIEYVRDAKSGKSFRHVFEGKNVRLFRTKAGTHLIIGPVKAAKWIHG